MNRKTITFLVIVVVIAVAVMAITEWQRNLATTRLLSELAKTEDYPKVMDAMEQLHQRGGRIMPALISKLQAPEPQVRWRAAMLLGEVGSKKAWAGLTDALDKDQSADVRAAAALALGKLNAKTSAEAIRTHLADVKENLDVRLNSAIALGYLQDKASLQVLEAVAAKRPPVPKPVPEKTAAATATPAPATVKDVTKPETKSAAKSVAKPAPTPAPAAPAAPAPPPDTLYELRCVAVRSMGQLADKTAIPILIDSANALKEPHAEVRTAAAYALGDLARKVHDREDCRNMIQGLIQCMNAKVEKTGDVRAAAIHSLQFITIPSESDKDVKAVLTITQSDDFYWARQATEQTIENLGINLN